MRSHFRAHSFLQGETFEAANERNCYVRFPGRALERGRDVLADGRIIEFHKTVLTSVTFLLSGLGR